MKSVLRCGDARVVDEDGLQNRWLTPAWVRIPLSAPNAELV